MKEEFTINNIDTEQERELIIEKVQALDGVNKVYFSNDNNLTVNLSHPDVTNRVLNLIKALNYQVEKKNSESNLVVERYLVEGLD